MVFDLMWTRFAWQGLDTVGADFLLDTNGDDDAWIDAVAQYLWNTRR